jgi:hypothetical protein
MGFLSSDDIALHKHPMHDVSHGTDFEDLQQHPAGMQSTTTVWKRT